MKSRMIFLFIATVFTVALLSEVVIIDDTELSVQILESNDDITRIEYVFGSFEKLPVFIDNHEHFRVSLGNESVTFKKGYPELPKITRSIIIPDEVKVEVRIIKTSFKEFKLDVAPSKGLISREKNPEDIPYEFADVYSKDSVYPDQQVELGSPYILRDFRGIVVNVYPFSYNPKSKILRVYHHIEIEIFTTGNDTDNLKIRNSEKINKHFLGLYKRHFINFDRSRYTSIDEHGRIIVICCDLFTSAIEPYVSWKKQKGIPTDLYSFSSSGLTANAIKSFIQSEYDSGDGLTFVQLVGDAAQIPTFFHLGGGSDPSYALVDGDDNYPDIFIGRFSAENISELNTQVERTIHYEKYINSGSWLHKGTGLASDQGAGIGDDNEADWQHADVIRGKLLAYTYTEIDQFYDTVGATATDVVNALNTGRGIINYAGHGGTGGWATTGFNSSHVNSLQNDYMLPFIQSVACVNGNFTGSTCFAEAWLRATNNSNGNPTGAIAMYASSINQSWAPPMRAQDEAIDLLVGDFKNTIGGLWFNGSCNMIDVYGAAGVDMYKTWHIFGDASLQVRTDAPTNISAIHDSHLLIGQTSFFVDTNVSEALVCLYDGTNILASDYANVNGDINLTFSPITDVGTYYLTVTAYNKITYVGSVMAGTVGYWIGAVSVNWHNPNNWFGDQIPSQNDDVTIPAGTPQSPNVLNGDAVCRDLTIESGASLTIGPRTLTVDGNAIIHGQLKMNLNSGKLICNNNLYWKDGSTANFTAANVQIDVYRTMQFSSQANVQMNNGSVFMKGYDGSTIDCRSSSSYLNNLNLAKWDDIVYLGTSASTALKVNGNLSVTATTTVQNLYSNNDLILAGNLISQGQLLLDYGKVEFTGTDQQVNLAAGSYFKNVELNGSVVLQSDVTIKGNLDFGSGTLIADNGIYDIYIGGNWLYQAGGFTPGYSRVIFNGTGDQTCNGGGFYRFTLNKSGGRLKLSGTNFIGRYSWSNGTITILSGYHSIMPFQSGINGNWQIYGGTVNFWHPVSIDLKGSMSIYDGAVNISGGSGDSRWPGSNSAHLLMEGGTLCVEDHGININNDYPFPHQIAGGTIETVKDFTVTRSDFAPAGGTIRLSGTSNANIYWNSSNSLVNLDINKRYSGTVTVQTDLDLSGSLTITKGIFNLNGHQVSVAANAGIGGTLKMTNAADQLTVGGNVVWNDGSADDITNGEITLSGDWKFLQGTNAALGSGNTVRFVGNNVSEIYITEFDNAGFGSVVLDKSNNYTVKNIDPPTNMKVAGSLTLNADNEFRSANLTLSGTLSMAAGSLLHQVSGTFNANSDVLCSGHLKIDGATCSVDQNFTLNTGGILTITNQGAFNNYKSYTGNFLTFAGTLNLLSGNMVIWDENVRFTTTPNLGANSVLELGRGMQATTANAFQPSQGSVRFFGSQFATIQVNNGNYFHDLSIEKSNLSIICNVDGDLKVNNDLTVYSGKLTSVAGNSIFEVGNDLLIQAQGQLNPAGSLVKVGGFWSNNRGESGFVEGEGTVRLYGSIAGGIATDETFYNLYIDKDYGTFYYTEIAEGKTVHIENELKLFNGKLNPKANSTLDVDGLFYLANGTGIRVFEGADGVNICVGGHWDDNNVSSANYLSLHPGSSTLTFDGTENQVFAPALSSPKINNLVINKPSGSFIPYMNLTIDGNLSILSGDWSDHAYGYSHTFLGSVNICQNGWGARQSTVTFGGTSTATFQQAGSPSFYNIIIDKDPSDSGRDGGELTLLSTINAIWGGTLTVQSGTLNANGQLLNCSGDVMINGGKLLLNDNSILKVGDSKMLKVSGSGRLESLGSAGSEVTITNNVYNGYHDVYVWTGTIAAEHTIFKRMTTDGVFVSFWGHVDPVHSFHNCTFQDGVSGGYLLRVRNDQDFAVNDAVFPANTWGSAYNVYKNINQGRVEFISASGDFSGESHDYDPYNRIDWTIPPAPPEISVTPSFLNYGDVMVGTSQISGFYIQNTGELPLLGTITAPDGYTVAYFSGDGDEIRENRNTIDFSVEGGITKSYSVVFAPLLVQNYDGNIVIAHNAAGDDEIVAVTGNGTPIPPPSIGPDELVFGNVQLGEEKMLSFFIQNNAPTNLTGSILTPAGYTVAEDFWENAGLSSFATPPIPDNRNTLAFDLPAGYWMNYYVTFAPTAMQSYDGDIVISFDVWQDELLSCTGSGIDARFVFDPWGIQKILETGQTASETVTMGNEGNVDIDYLAYIEYEGSSTTILSESFEGDFPPSAWILQSMDGGGNWEHCDYSAYAGSKSALADPMNVDNARLITPYFNATPDCILQFWVRGFNPDQYQQNAVFEVEVSPLGSGWTTLKSYSQEIFSSAYMPKGLALGSYAGQTIRLAFRVQDNNLGSGIHLDYVNITGTDFPMYSWLSLDGGHNISGILPVGSPNITSQIGFNTTGLGDGGYFGYIRFISNDSSAPISAVTISLSVGVYGLTITPSALNFGEVLVGEEDTRQFTMQNTGTLELSGYIVSPACYSAQENFRDRSADTGENSREDVYYLLFPGDDRTYTVTFAPQNITGYDDEIQINHLLGVSETIPVSGLGIAAEIALSPAILNQQLQPEAVTYRSLSVFNNGGAELNYAASIQHNSDNRSLLVQTGFEEATFPPAGWSTQIAAGTGNWIEDMTFPYSGMKCAKADPLIEDSRLITPAFTASSDTELKYYIRTTQYAMYGGNFTVEVSTDGMNWSQIEYINISNLTNSYIQKTNSLAAYSGSNIQIAFRMYNMPGMADPVYIDDVEIGSPPPPTDQWLTLNGGSTVFGTIASGSPQDVINVGFDAAGLPGGTYTAHIIFDSNDPFVPQISVLTELVVGIPQIVASPDSVGFGKIFIGEQSTSIFNIQNTGTIVLSGTISAPAGFTVSDQSIGDHSLKLSSDNSRNTIDYEISAGFSEQFDLTFTPTETGEYQGNLIITHNAPGEAVQIIAAGEGVTIPTVTTDAITNITADAATGGGEVTADGGSVVQSRGVCWNLAGNPTLADDFTTDGSDTGVFVSELTSLAPGCLYYVRAYAQNHYGIAYGDQVTFTTQTPIITLSVNDIPSFGDVGINSISTTQSYTVSGQYLVDNIEITAPTGFEISLNSGDNIRPDRQQKTTSRQNRDFGSGLILTPVNGNISATTIYVRFSPLNAVAYSDTIRHFSASSNGGGVFVSGNGVTSPQVTTDNISNIGSAGAVCGGNVTCDGNTAIIARGVCWSTTPDPTLADDHSIDGTGTGEFISILSDLQPDTQYYVRAYAVNTLLISYGNQKTFTTYSPYVFLSEGTLDDFGEVVVSAISTEKSYYLIASNLIDDLLIDAPDGFQISLTSGQEDSGSRDFTSQLTLIPQNGQIPMTSIFVRFAPTTAAIYSGNIAHSSSAVTTMNVAVSGTGITVPSVNTAAITEITQTTASGGGNVKDDGNSAVTARGVCWSTNTNPTLADDFTTDGSGSGAFVSSLTGLAAGTIYYVRAYATNTVGTAYGNEVNFTTAGTPLITVSATELPAFGNIPVNTASAEQNYTVSAIHLTNDLTITAPAGFAISLISEEDMDNFAGIGGSQRDFGSEIVLTPTGGVISSTTIYVRFQPALPGAYSSNISHTSNGAAEKNVAVSGTGITVPSVTTAAITEITQTTATGGGNVTDDGNSAVTARGVCWSTSANPTLADDFTTDGSGSGAFVSSLTGLAAGTTYYVRAYATNAVGTAYGNEVNFTTAGTPLITVSAAELPAFGNIPVNTASAEQNYTVSAIHLTNDLTITAPAGFAISLISEEDMDNFAGIGGSQRDFGSEIVLTPTGGVVSSTTIYVRFQPTLPGAYSSNISHTSSGAAEKNVAVSGTGITVASVTTAAITEITQTTATGGGNVTDDGNSAVTARGVCWSTSTNPTLADDFTTDGSGTGAFVSSLTGLAAGTTYYVRAYATNVVGTAYGNQQVFETLPDLPPAPPANVTITVSGGNVNLSWSAVDGADSYKVYSSNDPSLALENWNLEEANIAGTNWSEAIPANRKFYYVKAVN